MPRAAAATARTAPARSAAARGAAARSAPARRAPARSHPAPRRTPAPARPKQRRAAGAVTAPRPVAIPRGARVLDALLTGRAWIALVGLLLAGIVFFNVDLLQMNRDITQMADRAAQIKRENDRLRHDYARLASSERIQEAAASLGLVLPAPGEVRYLEARPRQDAHTASKRMTAPDLTYIPPEPITQAPPELPVAGTTPSTTIPPQ